jgi:hypothetical protein
MLTRIVLAAVLALSACATAPNCPPGDQGCYAAAQARAEAERTQALLLLQTVFGHGGRSGGSSDFICQPLAGGGVSCQSW